MSIFDDIPLVDTGSSKMVHQAILQDLIGLQKAAASHGLNLSVASGYRSIGRQTQIWNDKWCGNRVLYAKDGSILDYSSMNETELLYAILNWSALPGASRHHWGTDIDVYDAEAIKQTGCQLKLVDNEYAAGGPCHSLYQFLLREAGNYGFFQPFSAGTGKVAEEKWHISHKATAHAFEQSINKEWLRHSISNTDILGKQTILQYIDDIYDGYVHPYLC